MTPAPWQEEAARMLAEGMTPDAIGRQLGVNASTVRVRLDINGALAKYQAKLERNRHEGKNRVINRKASREAHVTAPTPLLPPKVSVPYVSMLVGVLDRPYRMVRL